MGWMLAVHIGAGRYGESATSEAAYLALLHSALETSRHLLTAQDADNAASVTRAASVASHVLGHFERHALTNCGRGSNLTARGVVECEASVACGRSRVVTACAGVQGVAEPSALAHALLTNATDTTKKDCLGREPPLVLVGDGARAFAASMGLETATSASEVLDYQVTDAATQQWRKWHARVVGETETPLTEGELTDERLDTVGVVCVDPEGNVAAALSSGGVLYKTPGRVGLAGCPRVGADARNAASLKTGSDNSPSSRKRPRQAPRRHGFAIACTGRGEQFIRSAFVSTLARRLERDDSAIDDALRASFDEAQADNNGTALEGGVLALSMTPLQRRSKRLRAASSTVEAVADHYQNEQLLPLGRTVQLGVAFTTPCMGVGYLHDGLREPRVQILRQPDKKASHVVVHVSCVSV